MSTDDSTAANRLYRQFDAQARGKSRGSVGTTHTYKIQQARSMLIDP